MEEEAGRELAMAEEGEAGREPAAVLPLDSVLQKAEELQGSLRVWKQHLSSETAGMAHEIEKGFSRPLPTTPGTR